MTSVEPEEELDTNQSRSSIVQFKNEFLKQNEKEQFRFRNSLLTNRQVASKLPLDNSLRFFKHIVKKRASLGYDEEKYKQDKLFVR